jgi:drug/metabolite transporter (DMT)-like permease
MTRLAGPIFILIFGLSQAVRDVWFGDVFQGYGFFFVVFCIFGLSTLAFLLIAAVTVPAELRGIWRHASLVFWMNITTALAWTCYFFGLKYVEPSVVNTIHSGMGPLTVLALGLFGAARAGKARSFWEAASYVGIGISIVLLFLVVLTGWSGVPTIGRGEVLLGLCLLFVSGSSITLSLMLSKRLHDAGFGSLAVTAVRYLGAVATSGVLAHWLGQGFSGTLPEIAALSGGGFLLVVVPTFILQMGIARTPALTAQVIRSLSPVFVFAFEQFDPRVTWSAPVLAIILFYSVCAIGANVTRGWGGKRESGAERASLATPAPT